MSTVSLAPDVIAWLVNSCQTSVQLGQASPSVLVFDGPHVTDSQLDARSQKLWIGYDPMAPGSAAAEADQDFAGLDMALKRNESGWVTLAAEDSSGDVAMAGLHCPAPDHAVWADSLGPWYWKGEALCGDSLTAGVTSR